MVNTTKRRTPRRGATIIEVILCVIILSAAVVGIGRFSGMMKQSLRERELNALIHWEVQDVRETVRRWPLDQITPENIEALTVSANLQRELQQVRWQATVQAVQQPLEALRIDLELVGERYGQSVNPRQLVFWVPRGDESS